MSISSRTRFTGSISLSLKKLCNHPGCRRFAEEGSRYCSEHQPEPVRKDFKGEWLSDSQKAFYNSARWKRERAEFLKANPECAICGAPATDVHHEWGDEDFHTSDRFWLSDHWVPLCSDCHDRISKEVMARRRSKSLKNYRERKHRPLWY